MTSPGTHARTRPGGHKKPRLLSPPLGRRSFVRVDMALMSSTAIGALTDCEFRAWLALLSYVARFRGKADPINGEFPRSWARFATYWKPRGVGKVTRKQLERFVAIGLLDELEDEDGEQWLGVVDWRDVHPLEWTGAIRQARWRERHGRYGRRARRYDDPWPADAEPLDEGVRASYAQGSDSAQTQGSRGDSGIHSPHVRALESGRAQRRAILEADDAERAATRRPTREEESKNHAPARPPTAPGAGATEPDFEPPWNPDRSPTRSGASADASIENVLDAAATAPQSPSDATRTDVRVVSPREAAARADRRTALQLEGLTELEIDERLAAEFAHYDNRGTP